ncbi:MAG: hypothetical protein D6727_04005 [Gammaproteobacteria bacterium]|nr:MAG: hypothetical protein D6727_04005 [Gammaproteobacteria bacterium]
MGVCHRHNLPAGRSDAEARFGIRVSLPPGDPFRRLLGDDWQAEHWFADRASRDAALRDMAARHRYSRIGDEPRLIFEPIER